MFARYRYSLLFSSSSSFPFWLNSYRRITSISLIFPYLYYITGLYIVTEYVDGGDVRNLMKGNTLTWPKRLQIASDLAKAMFYLHSKKIIHRDLKSKNLLVSTYFFSPSSSTQLPSYPIPLLLPRFPTNILENLWSYIWNYIDIQYLYYIFISISIDIHMYWTLL